MSKNILKMGFSPLKGRISRAAFLGFTLLLFAGFAALGFYDNFDPNNTLDQLLSMVFLCWMLFQTCLGVRRLHDTNHSGWFIWLFPYSLYLVFRKGDRGPNDYGDDPLDK
ncbi:MAG TPA: DUF805 domain-containing protein [Gammaproteobacteria bacterium]|nr:DUF805 domain-containing protein [Gammaproteobacteria bacterium]